MRSRSLLVLAVAVLAAALAAWLFPRAFPIIALQQSLTRERALARADSFLAAHALRESGARTAVRFTRDDSLRTFIELAGGGHDSLNAYVRGRDVAPFKWSVRSFTPGKPQEARVDFAPDGRVIGFDRRLAEADSAPAVTADSGRRLAETALGAWIGERLERWTLVSSSYQTRKTSGRVDRTYTFERTDRKIGGAPIRTDVVVAGDVPSTLRQYVRVPESFMRRYGEMRSWNEALALLATVGILLIGIAGVVALSRFAKERQVRWREPLVVGGVIGALMLAAGVNELPGSWFGYDTAMSATTFQAMQVLVAVSLGVSTALLVGLTLAAAEAATRRAFPKHLDWWKLWRYRGTSDVAARVGGGYAVAAIAFAYVALFYVVTRTVFGWWVPSELLDDPNQIASPMPWVSGIAISLQAGVWEEAMFRALPLSLLALWIGDRPHRRWWLAGGVVLSALVFGFAHSSYESWPPYSRGVEIFLDAAFWAVLFLAFGLLVTVIAHFLYDAVLFGIFASQGSAVEYRVTAGIILAVLVAPAAVVLWRRVRHGAFVAAPDDARFAAWTPDREDAPAPAPAPRPQHVLTARSRRLALGALVAGIVVAVGSPRQPTLGPRFTVDRARAIHVADSLLRARGGDPAGWRRLASVGRDTLNSWPRFVREHDLESRAQQLARTYVPPAWWIVRYVHTDGTSAQRAEEWRVRVWPDGAPLDVRHLLPDSAARDSADAGALRRIASAALARAGLDTLVLKETNVEETARPARRDVTITYTDTSVKLPAGAAARAFVQLAGTEPLVARRSMELPEAFVRADRERQSNRMMVAVLSTLLALGIVITGVLVVKRRRPVLVDDGALDRRQRALALAALAVLTIVGNANSLPDMLFRYDTAQPWSTFVAVTTISLLLTTVVVLILWGLWLVLSAMRRRAGIPMRAGDTPAAAMESVITGLGIGGICYASAGVTALAAQGAMPRAASTGLPALLPWLGGVPGLPADTIGSVAVVAIPLLVIAALTPRWPLRVLLAGALIALLTTAAWSMEPGTERVAPVAVLAILTGVAAAAAVLMWGRHSGASWFMAALAFSALSALRDVVYAPVWQERVAGILTFAACVALMLLLHQRIARPGRIIMTAPDSEIPPA